MEYWQFSPILTVYFAGACLAFLLSFLAWNLKPFHGTKVFSMALLAAGIWVLGYVFEVASTSEVVKLILVRIQYLGLMASICLWIIFVINYTQLEALKKNWFYIFISIVPAVSFIEVLFFTCSNFFYQSYQLETIDGLKMFTYHLGLGFYIWAGYAYFILIASLFIVLMRMRNLPRKYRNQIIPLATSVSIIILPNILYITGNNPLAPFDPTSLFFVLVGGIMLYSIQFQKFLDIVPVAHNIVLKNAKMGIVIIDDHDRILEINPSAQRIFGCCDNQFIGKQIKTILPQFDDLVNNSSELDTSLRELHIGQRNRIYEIKIAPLQEKTNEPKGKIIMLWDVTEMKNAYSELDAYAHTVAHDLKTPMAQVISFINLIKSSDTKEEEKAELLDYVETSGLRMCEIIDELLVLAQIRNIDAYKSSSLNMDELITNAINRYIPASPNFEINIEKPDTWPEIESNNVWVEEVWANLISNAYKYGGRPLKIKIDYQETNDMLNCAISDNGQGISHDEQEKLFSKFARLAKHEKHITGHGLGLSIVQRIVEKLGGKIWLESSEGVGSTFYFSLPKT